MREQNLHGKWEKRFHPLREQWVVYAAHRNSRPWSYEKNENVKIPLLHDPKCYLCPGNTRISGITNPHYQNNFIFENDHPVVGSNAPEILDPDKHSDLYQKAGATGISRVISYHPRHDLTMSSMSLEEVTKVFFALKEQMVEMLAHPQIKFVLIFENKGELVGVSNPHPHCQLYATDFVFELVKQELNVAQKYRQKQNKNIFQEIINAEIRDEIRIIAENENAIAFIPFFARYAYEVMIFPKKRHATLITLNDVELQDLAQVFQEVNRRYDMNYQMSFPYVMSIMQAPVDRQNYEDYHLHLLIQPPLRQPGLQKFLAGPEIGGGNFMADTIPEEKARELQAVKVDLYDPSISM